MPHAEIRIVWRCTEAAQRAAFSSGRACPLDAQTVIRYDPDPKSRDRWRELAARVESVDAQGHGVITIREPFATPVTSEDVVAHVLQQPTREERQAERERREAEREAHREAHREAEREAHREAQREAREAEREAQREAREAQREAQREAREAEREATAQAGDSSANAAAAHPPAADADTKPIDAPL